jgi:nitroreductase
MRRIAVGVTLALLTVTCAQAQAPQPSAAPTADGPRSTSGAASSAPIATPSSAPAAPERLADVLASALSRSDYGQLKDLITPTGWTAAFYQSEGTKPLTRDEAIAWLRSRAAGGTLEAVVQPRPVLDHIASQPPGDRYIRSTWSHFATIATQNVELILRSEGQAWYWTGALFSAPVR